MTGPIASPTDVAPPVMGQALPIELMCTIWADRQGAHDSLGTDAGVEAWLAGLGERAPLGPAPAGADRERLQGLRDAVRRVAAHITNDVREYARGLPADVRTAIATINETAASTLTPPALRLESTGSVGLFDAGRRDASAVLSTLAVDAIEFLGSPQSAELRTCQAPGCVLYFIKDHPLREWCSPGCGNRVRAARHYAKRRRND